MLLIFFLLTHLSFGQDCCTVAQSNKTCPTNNYLWCTSCQNNQCQQECKNCTSLISNCAQCDCAKFLCLACQQGYILANLATKCLADSAINYSATAVPSCNGNTLSCQDGYYFDISKTCLCQKCVYNCLKCYNSQQCQVCASDTYIHTGLLYQDQMVCYRDKDEVLVNVQTNISTLNLGAGWTRKRCCESSFNLAYGVKCLKYEEMCIIEKYCNKVFEKFRAIIKLSVMILVL